MGHCTFCSLECPLLNLCFSSSPSFPTNGDENCDYYPLSLSEPFDIDTSCVFKILGIKYNDETSFPACPSCVVDFQEIEKHFKNISNILNEIKNRRASSPPTETESLETIEIKEETIEIKEESIDVEEFCQFPQSPFGPSTEEPCDPSPDELPAPSPEEPSIPSQNQKDKKSVNEVALGHTTEGNVETNSCSICGSTFSSSWRMRVHRVEFHGIKDQGPSFRCPTCELLFTTEHRLNLHRSLKHGEKVHKPKKPDLLKNASNRSKPCSICGKTFSGNFKLRYHRVEIHGVENEGLSYPCPTCNLKFATEQRLNVHRRDRHGVKMPSKKPNTECKACEKSFPTRKSFNKHMTTHDPSLNEIIQCNVCSRPVARKGLKGHMETHVSKGNESVKCNICSKHFTRLTLKRHIKRVHEKDEDGTKWTCYFCGMTFYQFYYLDRHIRTHTNERPFLCSNCGKDFTRVVYLKRHFKSCGR